MGAIFSYDAIHMGVHKHHWKKSRLQTQSLNVNGPLVYQMTIILKIQEFQCCVHTYTVYTPFGGKGRRHTRSDP